MRGKWDRPERTFMRSTKTEKESTVVRSFLPAQSCLRRSRRGQTLRSTCAAQGSAPYIAGSAKLWRPGPRDRLAHLSVAYNTMVGSRPSLRSMLSACRLLWLKRQQIWLR